MFLIKDLINWFFSGKNLPQEKTESHQPAKLQNPSPFVAPRFVKTVVPREEFLRDLKTIEPLNRLFEKDYEDMIQELKNLAPRRSSDHADRLAS